MTPLSGALFMAGVTIICFCDWVANRKTRALIKELHARIDAKEQEVPDAIGSLEKRAAALTALRFSPRIDNRPPPTPAPGHGRIRI